MSGLLMTKKHAKLPSRQNVRILTVEKLPTISCTSDLIGAIYMILNSSALIFPSGLTCFPISLNIVKRATLVLPAPYNKFYKIPLKI